MFGATLHLSCIDTATISKRTETRFHKTHVTHEFHQVHPKEYLSLWYTHCKPWTYLVSRLALSPNGLNRASTWALLSLSTIWCVQNDFWANGTFGANSAPILHWHWHRLQTDRNKIPHDPHHLEVPSSVSKMIFVPVVPSAQTVHLSCVKISTIFKRTESSIHLSLVT
jgi:hypothetical protein